MQERSDFGLMQGNGVDVVGPQQWQAQDAPEQAGLAEQRLADRTWMNRTALWLALGGLFVPFVSALAHIAAIVLAVLGLRAAKAGQADSRAAAIVALVVSALALLAYVPFTLMLLNG